jgi:hypothetical protein
LRHAKIAAKEGDNSKEIQAKGTEGKSGIYVLISRQYSITREKETMTSDMRDCDHLDVVSALLT